MQKHVNLVDLVKSFPTNIYLQNLASIQKRTSPLKFAHFAEKSEYGSISNLSSKASTVAEDLASDQPDQGRDSQDAGELPFESIDAKHLPSFEEINEFQDACSPHRDGGAKSGTGTGRAAVAERSLEV